MIIAKLLIGIFTGIAIAGIIIAGGIELWHWKSI